MQNEIRLPLNECQPYPELLRSVDRESEEYQEFAAGIAKKGVLEPILVTPVEEAKLKPGGPKYLIVNGLQRWSASNDAGFTDIPVRIQTMNGKEVRDAQIIANACRIETKPKEYATALSRILADDPMLTKADLASRLCKSTSWLDQRLSLTKLNDQVGELVDSGKITLNNAIILAKLSNEDQEVFAQDAMTKDAGVLGAAVQQHLKEVRKAKLEGRPAGPVEYVPPPRLLKIGEVEVFTKDSNAVSVFLREQGIKTNSDTVQAATAAFQKCLNVDPLSLAARKLEYEEDKKAREAQAAVKKEEKEKQKLADAVAARQRLEAELAGV